MRKEADLSRLPYLLGAWAVDGSFVGYKGIEGGFEELWKAGAGIGRGIGGSSAACSGACRALWGLEDPELPLSSPTDVQPLLHLRSS
jgi:hypothetical protein